MRGCRRAPGLVLLLLAAPGAAAAQHRTGTVEVRVEDTAGRPAAGTFVTAAPEAGGESRHCTTRHDGRCVMLAVAPGTYRVFAGAASAAGDAAATVAPGEHTVLRLAPRAAEGHTLRAAGVPGGPPPASTVLDRQGLLDLPTRRTLFDALRFDLTQPSPGNWWLDAGGTFAPLRLFIDGVEYPASHSRGLHPGADALDALRLDTPERPGASSARGAGGAISAAWRAGASRLSGEGSLVYEGWRLNGPPRPFSRYSPWDRNLAERNLTVPATPWADLTPRFNLGGPLGPPRLSFHASGSFSRRDHHREVVFMEDPDRAARRFSWFSWSAQGSANLTAARSRGGRVRLAMSFGRSRNRGSAPTLEPDQGRLPDGSPTAGLTRAPFAGPAETQARWRDTGADARRFTLSPSIDWPIGEAWSLAAGAALSFPSSWTPRAFRGTGTRRVFATSNAKLPGISPDEVQAAGFADNPSSYGTVRDTTRRAVLSLEANWAPGRRRSAHLFSAGVRAERTSDEVYIGHEHPVIRLHWNRALTTTSGSSARGTYGYYTVTRPGTIGRAAGTSAAAWLQDRWSPGRRLSIEAGLRAEREAAPSYVEGPGVRTPVFGFGDMLAPRLSIAWKPDDAGAWRVQGWFGLYFDHLTTRLARTLFGARHDVIESWTLDTTNWRTLECDEGRRDCPGEFIERVDRRVPWNVADPLLARSSGLTTRIDPGLRPMQTGEWGAGIERRLARSTSLALGYTGKWLVRAVEDVGLSLPGVGERAVLANPGFGCATTVAPGHPAFPLPKATRRYHELEIELRRRGRPVALAARYRWSRLAGNYGGLAASDEGGRQSTNLTSAFDALYSSYDRFGRQVDGPLPGDRPHRLGLDATLALPSGTTLSVSALLESGRPESSEVTFRGVPVWFNGGGDLGRQPPFSQVDARVRQDVRVAAWVVTLEASVDNVFDQSASLGFFSNNPYRDALAVPEEAFFEFPWDPAAWATMLRTEGVRVRDEQLFLEPNRFQRPRRVVLTAALRF